MKIPKYYWFIILALIFSWLEFETALNVYWIIVLLVFCLYIVECIYKSHDESMKSKENKELQEEIRTTTKDAHLIYKQLLTVLSSIPFPMLLVDQFGHIVMHNNISELCIDDVDVELSYVNNPFYPVVREFIKDTFILEKSFDKVIEINQVEYQAFSVPILAKNKYSGCFILFQDISKTLEGEKMQKRFIADASHELKTPIAVLKGMIEILNRDDFNDEILQKEFLMQMEKEVTRLEYLVRDLLQLSRLSKTNVILEREKCNICLLLDKAYDSLIKKANDKNLEIIKDYQSDELAFCDPKKMLQVFINLISNAIKYSDHGKIILRTRTQGPYYIIEVIDEGYGMKEEELDKIFKRFYRIEKDRSRKSGGNGLGLAIVKSIVDAHDGKIEIDSEYQKGSTFRIKLKN